MPHLSICIPSKRGFAASKRAIGEALTVAEARDAVVVISDNSGDAEKRAYWRDRSPRIRYHESSAQTAFQNFLASVAAADTEFVMVFGDDDGISVDPSIATVDLASLPADFMGVRPRTEVLVTGHGVVREKTFGIDELTPTGRIREYSMKAMGDNSAFYSIFRRRPYHDLMDLFVNRHPIKGSFIDWAMALALFSYGRMAYDPGLVYRYNADQWASFDKTKARNEEIFAAAGLPAHTDLYQPLLMMLDLFVFVARPGTPLSREEALDAIAVTAGDIMNGFLNDVTRRPEKFSPRMRYLVELAQAEMDAFARFQLGLVMIDDLKPGLKDDYLQFFNDVMKP
jgi:hypothetical protein